MPVRNANTLAQAALGAAKQIQLEAPRHVAPPEKGFKSASERVLPFSIVRGTRGYIEAVANQANGCFERGWFDACAVMIRRLIEMLIIEAFEKHGIADKLKGPTGDFLYLSDLINITLAETSWNLTRNTKKALPKLKEVGDKSAHSRRFNAHLGDLEKLLDDVRTVVQELAYLADFNKQKASES